MDVQIESVKTFVVTMTEHQARNMLRLSRAIDANDIRPEYADVTGTLETLDDLRQALLSSGLQHKDPEK